MVHYCINLDITSNENKTADNFVNFQATDILDAILEGYPKKKKDLMVSLVRQLVRRWVGCNGVFSR